MFRRPPRDASAAAELRERRFAAAAHALASAARASPYAVCDALLCAARAAAPAVDGLLLYESEHGALRCTFARGERVAYFAGTVVAADDMTSPAARALRAGHRATLCDADARPIHPADAAAVAVPFDTEPARAAVVALVATDNLDAFAVDRIVLLAELAAPSYLVARDRERDRRTAEYDGLTGLLTPRTFRRRLTELVDRARALEGAALALIFVDTDDFKRWNDTYGHAAGDDLLRRIAAELRGTARERDLAARNGGDEFCLILTDTAKAAAIERAELLRRRIAAIDPRISASIGVAAFPADAASASDLLEHADGAMYHAKATGRNGVAYRTRDAFVRFEGEGTG